MRMLTTSPTLSVVIATYNRPSVLQYAIRSVLESTFTDWELIVVGDACTDDTSECVESFRDQRIRFINLPVNCGDQSGPNNHGIAVSRGRYIAFLNHDDLYLPDHLARAVAELEATEADLVWAPCAVASPLTGAGPSGPSDPPCSFSIIAVPSTRGYLPLAFYPASSWVFRRELAARVGPWPSADEAFVTTSQEWLFRTWRAGGVFRFVPRIGVIVVWSGSRAGSYSKRGSPEHEQIVRWMKEDERWRERLIEQSAMNTLMEHVTSHYGVPWWRHFARGTVHILFALLKRSGIHPLSLYMAARFGRRGGFIRWHRNFTGVANTTVPDRPDSRAHVRDQVGR
jgi:glycosyltransferase involved in cell wall biosynthesis